MAEKQTLKNHWDSVESSEEYKTFLKLKDCPYSTKEAVRKWLIKQGCSESSSEYISKKYSSK